MDEFRDPIRVTVSELPGSPKDVMLDGSRTVKTAVEIAGWNAANYSVVRVGSTVITDFDTELRDGEYVWLVEEVRGN